MNNRINFINDHWFWPVIIASVILLAIFIWKEIILSGKRRIILKSLLSLLAIATLALIALKPASPATDTSGKIVMITPGYEKKQLDSLRKENTRLKVVDYSSRQLEFAELEKAEAVYVLGHGIPHYDLRHLEDIPVEYIPGNSPEGIIKLRYSEKIAAGEDLNIRGIYNRPRPGHRLVLQAPGGVGLDSVDIGNDPEQPFQLIAELKAPGNFVYFLTEKNDEGQILTSDPVPVQVEEKVNLRILVLNNFPTFETKYLKNFLAEAGHEVVVRSQITTGRFKYEYFNANRTVIGNLSREALEAYDLLIIDAASLQSLGSSYSGALLNAVGTDGLGVFIQPDEAFFRAPGNFNLKFNRERRDFVQLEEWPEVDLSIYPFVFDASPDFEAIHKSGTSIITGYTRNGKGRIGTTILSNTWQLILGGNSEVYGEMWSRVIGQVSKRDDDILLLEPQKEFVFPQEPYQFKIRTKTPNPVITDANGRLIPVMQDINFPEQWKGTTWPREHGWQKLQQDTIAVDFYVAEEESWKPLIAHNTLLANRLFFDRSREPGVGHRPLEPINPLWFYSLFLLCMGGLWLEPKIS